MFLDSGIPALLKAAIELGATGPNIKLYAAGGAQILDSCGFFSVGLTNCEVLDSICRQHGVQIHGKMLGGQESCSIFLQVASGDVWVKLSGQPQQVFLCKNSTTT
jgi:chemotaxis receptor (MCP) glutamine deamidase CheD